MSLPPASILLLFLLMGTVACGLTYLIARFACSAGPTKLYAIRNLLLFPAILLVAIEAYIFWKALPTGSTVDLVLIPAAWLFSLNAGIVLGLHSAARAKAADAYVDPEPTK